MEVDQRDRAQEPPSLPRWLLDFGAPARERGGAPLDRASIDALREHEVEVQRDPRIAGDLVAGKLAVLLRRIRLGAGQLERGVAWCGHESSRSDYPVRKIAPAGPRHDLYAVPLTEDTVQIRRALAALVATSAPAGRAARRFERLGDGRAGRDAHAPRAARRALRRERPHRSTFATADSRSATCARSTSCTAARRSAPWSRASRPAVSPWSAP